MPKINVGRDDKDFEEYGLKGTGVIGKHLVGENEEAHTANPIYFDLARPHVMGIFGKRGTGKCLLPDEKILTENGLKRIEDLFRQASNEGNAEIDQKDEQLYSFKGSSVQSIRENFSNDSNNIKAGYRKKVDEKLLKIETRSGREITVTAEHPLLTVNGWRNADNISESDKLGLPRQIDLDFNDRELDIPKEFETADYSNLNRRESELLNSKGGKITDVSDNTGSFRRVVKNAESKGLVQVQKSSVKVTQTGRDELEERKSETHYRFKKSKPIKLPSKVTPEFGEFLASLIAEGHEQKISENNYRIIFTNKDQNILERFQRLGEELFDLDFKKMDETSVYANSLALEEFLKNNGFKTGKNSFNKGIPDFIVASSNGTASQFLRTYFDCEANVTNQQIELSTASREIANSINYMLLRFGIIGRTTEKKKYASNTEDQKVRNYQQITISGSKQLSQFKRRIDFSMNRKSKKLGSIIKEDNTNVDTVPCGGIIQECREAMAADRTQIAKHKQSLKAYEDNKYQPSRQKLEEINSNLKKHLIKLERLYEQVKKTQNLDILEEFIDFSGITWKQMNESKDYSRTDKKFLSYKKYQKNPEKLVDPALRLFEKSHNLKKAEEKLDKLYNLSNSDIYWDEIENIEKIDYEGWVYDLTVAENHSFTGGFGGLFCHNSYSMGTIAEELQTTDISQNVSTIVIDSMGIYWSMKRPNERAAGLLEKWDLNPDTYDAKVYIPEGKVDDFEEREMPYDDTFTLNPGDLTSNEWIMAFRLDRNSEAGVLLERVISELRDHRDNNFSIDDILEVIDQFDFPNEVENRLENRFMNAKEWGIFGEESSFDKFTNRGELSVIDTSVFGEMGGGWSVRALVVGLMAKRILKRRMTARRIEEIDEMEGISQNEMPITWMLIDEAHEFLPADGKTAASHPLMRWVKIGREPGVSLVLATQQPAKLHPDALSQCDIILSHRLTSKEDIDALGEIMHTYMRHDIQHYIDSLPDAKGVGLLLDDNSERIYPVQMRPRKSWHAGGTPDAFD